MNPVVILSQSINVGTEYQYEPMISTIGFRCWRGAERHASYYPVTGGGGYNAQLYKSKLASKLISRDHLWWPSTLNSSTPSSTTRHTWYLLNSVFKYLPKSYNSLLGISCTSMSSSFSIYPCRSPLSIFLIPYNMHQCTIQLNNAHCVCNINRSWYYITNYHVLIIMFLHFLS